MPTVTRDPALRSWAETCPDRPTRLLLAELCRIGFDVVRVVDNRALLQTHSPDPSSVVLVVSMSDHRQVTHVVVDSCFMPVAAAIEWAKGQDL